MIYQKLVQLSQFAKSKVLVRPNIPEIIFLAIVAVYAIAFSYLTVLKLQALGMHAWDFGIYLQAIHTTATSGKLFFSTAELPYTSTAMPFGTEFAVHFSPILFLVVPIYAVFQNAATLLVVKSLAIASGAIPVFLLAKKVLGKSSIGLVFAAGYLLYPVVQGINWWDFEPQVFFMPLVLFTIFFVESKRYTLALPFSILAMSTVEIAPFFIAALGVSYLLIQRRSILEFLRRRNFASLFKSIPVMLIVVAIVWLAIVFLTLALFGWQTSFHSSNQRRLSIAGSADIVGALSNDWQAKLLFLGLVFGPFAFLSLFDPVFLLPGGIWIAYAMFSNYLPYYTLGFQYMSFAVPFVLASSVFGLKRIYGRLKGRRTQFMTILLGFTICVSTVVASPIGPYHVANNAWIAPFGFPVVTYHDQLIHTLVDLIPANASVLAGADLFPLVAERLDSYVFPFSATFPTNSTCSDSTIYGYTSFNSTLDYYLRKVDYVLYDGTADITAVVVFPEQAAAREFGVYAEADGAVLLKKGYVGSPVVFMAIERTFTSSDIVPVGSSVVYDASSESGRVLYHYSPDLTSDLWYGPGVFLSQGSYSVEFKLKVEGAPMISLISLAVIEWPTNYNIAMDGSASMWYMPRITFGSDEQTVLSNVTLKGVDFAGQMHYQSFSLEFEIKRPGSFEFAGLSVPNNTRVYLDRITLKQVAP